jgi:hypothetical protein
VTALEALIQDKVDKEPDKGLSSNDFSDADKNIIEGVNVDVVSLLGTELTGKYYDTLLREQTFESGRYYSPLDLTQYAGKKLTIVISNYSSGSVAAMGFGTTGTPIAGPVLHVFGPSKTYCRFYASGGTDTFDVEAETTWTASTPTFVSLSPSTGASGTTTVTVTCPSWTGETRREEIITFTDADDWTFDVKMRQRANTQVFSNIYLGDNQVLTMYIGDNNVSTIYLGDNDVFSS